MWQHRSINFSRTYAPSIWKLLDVPSMPKFNSWSKMAAVTPATNFIFWPVGKRKE